MPSAAGASVSPAASTRPQRRAHQAPPLPPENAVALGAWKEGAVLLGVRLAIKRSLLRCRQHACLPSFVLARHTSRSTSRAAQLHLYPSPPIPLTWSSSDTLPATHVALAIAQFKPTALRTCSPSEALHATHASAQLAGDGGQPPSACSRRQWLAGLLLLASYGWPVQMKPS